MKKHLGQIFTPNWIVKLMLDKIKYYNSFILDKKIMEPSCGDGAFLSEIVERYIRIARENHWSNEQIKIGLEDCIYGIELDQIYYEMCLQNLNQIASNYNIHGVQWNIWNTDALKTREFDNKMDYVIGNPPYVRVHYLEDEQREYIKENYFTCKEGNFDLYLAFYELGIKMLNDNGKLIYITPNSFLFNTFAKKLRDYIIENNLLAELINFESNKLFQVSTYNAIMILDRNKIDTLFKYYTYQNESICFVDELDLANFKDKKWNFCSKKNLDYLNTINNSETKIGDKVNVQYALVTLRDKIYISDCIEELNEEYILFNGFKIERELLHPIVKINKYNGNEIKSYILFPYIKNENNEWEPIEEENMKVNYPFAYHYFLQFKNELLNRDLDENAKVWYQLGRSQGIQNIDKRKLILKNIIRKNARAITDIYILPPEVFVYSGIFITGEELEHIKEILSSPFFFHYIKIIGKDLSNDYKTFNAKAVKNFPYDLKSKQEFFNECIK